MKNYILRVIPILIILSLIITVISGLSIETDDQTTHLVILHINDTHGNIFPYDTKDEKNIGGMARVAHLINEIKKANKDKTLVLHAGDELSRGDEITVGFGGEANLLMIESMGFDAFIPGNGDFYFGINNLAKQTSLVKMPILHANVAYKDTNEKIFKPYIIKEINGLKVAILGLGVIREDHPSGIKLKLNDPIQVAKELMPELKSKSDLIIALTHIGLGADVLLAEKFPEIDVIVGGHSHNQLDKPMTIPRKDGKGNIIIVQAGEYCRFLGKLDIFVKKDVSGKYNIARYEGKLIPINKEIKEDEKILAFLKNYSDKLSEIVFRTDAKITNKDSDDYPVGIFIADAVKNFTKADIALLDIGSAQSSIKKGNVTLRDIYKIHPWRNHVRIYNITGKQIENALLEKDLFASGCSYKKTDGIINNIKVGDSDIDIKKIYKVAIDEFLAFNMKSLENISFIETDEIINSMIIEMGQ